jgi:hypothetical protein
VRVAICVAGVLLASVAHADEGEPARDHLVIQIDSVHSTTERPDNGGKWDGEKPGEDFGCDVLGLLGDVAYPGAGRLAASACRSSRQQRERDPQAPDLFVQLASGRTVYRSMVVADTYSADFGYQFRRREGGRRTG